MSRFGRALTALVIVMLSAGPLGWIVRIAFLEDSGRTGFGNFIEVFRGELPGALANSALVALGTTLFALTLGAPAAFALAQLPLRGKSLILGASLAISAFPPISIVSPLYALIRSLGLRDHLTALVITDTTFTLPLALWLLTSFFRDVPRDLFAAARVDGCDAWQAFWRVCLPAGAPGLATAAILVFISAWNEFLFALTFISSPERRTVPVAISLLATGHKEPWGIVSASALIGTLPLLLAVALFQRRIVSGLTAGAVKE